MSSGALNDHLEKMQDMALRYLLPMTTYRDRDGRCSNDNGLDDGDERDQLFINDMIYMLDGPEQREAQADNTKRETRDA